MAGNGPGKVILFAIRDDDTALIGTETCQTLELVEGVADRVVY